MIDGRLQRREFETEKVNRKTIDADAMESITVVAGEKTRDVYNKSLGKIKQVGKFTNDTVFIKTEKERWTARATTSILKVMSEFRRLRKTEPDPTLLYFVDNQEIDSEN